jgi:hypothetical protein
MMHLVQQQNRCPPLRARFRFRPTALHEPRERCVRLVASCVYSLIAKPSCDFQKQRGFAHLPRPGEKLDAGWRGFPEPVEQHLAAWHVGVLNLSHNRIIIRLLPTNCQL